MISSRLISVVAAGALVVAGAIGVSAQQVSSQSSAHTLPGVVATAPSPSTSQTAKVWLKLHSTPPGGIIPIPEGPSFDSQGNMYVVSVFGDLHHNKIFKADLAHRTSQPIYADAPSTPGGTAIGPDNRLYVADLGLNSGRGRIISMKTDGSDVRVVVDSVDGKDVFPDDLVFDKAGNMFFTDMQGNVTDPTGAIFRRSSDGVVAEVLSGLVSPNGLAFAPSNSTLWVSEHLANRLVTVNLNSDGTVNNGSLPGSGVITLANLSGGEVDSLTVDADGNVYAAMYKAGRVDVFDKTGTFVRSLRPEGGATAFPNTSHVAIKPGTRDGFLLAGGADGAEIFRFRALAPGLR